jgi:hypothetical protein
MMAEVEDGVLGAAEHVGNRGSAHTPDEAAACHASQNVVVAQRDSAELAADEGGADVADDRFDFRELGHRPEI